MQFLLVPADEGFILAYFIFLADAGPPNVAGPGIAYSLPHFLDWPA